ncbi:hypothetical protein K1719_033017 [Acacia pycnantha]|nr:hypothetical protein K1719_033017 [Acacia pycnantha]
MSHIGTSWTSSHFLLRCLHIMLIFRNLLHLCVYVFQAKVRGEFYILNFGQHLPVDSRMMNLRDDAKTAPYVYVEPLVLPGEVLRCNPEAFECSAAGPLKEQFSGSVIPEKRLFESNLPHASQTQKDYNATQNRQLNFSSNDISMYLQYLILLRFKIDIAGSCFLMCHHWGLLRVFGGLVKQS